MEKAIIYSKNSFSLEMQKKYEIIYIGDEFCEYKMIKTIPKYKMNNKKYVLLTPILRDRYLNKARKIIQNFKPDEITINDIGLLWKLTNSISKYKINLGRILVKTNYLSFKSKFWQDIIKKINAIEIDDNSLINFLKEIKIPRIHFHTEYVYQSLTNNCLFKENLNCFKSNYCQNYHQIIYNTKTIMPKLFLKGNAYFLRNSFNKNLKTISRIIYSL